MPTPSNDPLVKLNQASTKSENTPLEAFLRTVTRSLASWTTDSLIRGRLRAATPHAQASSSPHVATTSMRHVAYYDLYQNNGEEYRKASYWC